MAVLTFTKVGKRWESDTIQPAKGNIEVRVKFKNPGGGFVGVLRSADGVEFTPFESGTKGNLGEDTKLLIFNVSGIVKGGYLKIISTSEVEAGSWIE